MKMCIHIFGHSSEVDCDTLVCELEHVRKWKEIRSLYIKKKKKKEQSISKLLNQENGGTHGSKIITYV